MHDKTSDIANFLYKDIKGININNINSEHINLINNILNKEEFLIFNFKNFDSLYTTGLLLTFPQLWLSLSKEQWGNISYQLFPRINKVEKTKMLSEDQGYGDMIFLHKILSLNPFQFWPIHKLLKTELAEAILFCETFTIKFFITNAELIEDLDDFYSIKIEDINSYTNKLLAEGCNSGFVDTYEMSRYIQLLKVKLSI